MPSATNADNATHANNADSATNATNATDANNADSATNADNANTVGGYAASSLNRVAIGSGSYLVTAGSPSVSVATVTIIAPTTGFVLVHGYVSTTSGTGAYGVRVRDNLNAATSVFRNWVTVSGGNMTGGNEGVFPVTAGSRSFSVTAEQSTATFVGWGTITAVFIPFGSTGSPTVL